MKEAICAGLLAGVSVFLVPGALLLRGISAPRQISPAPASIEITSESVQSPEPSERAISSIVVHQAEQSDYDASVTVTVNISGEARQLQLEDYLCGVLMGEMPPSFPLEALKAQAVAARTFTLRRLESGGVLSDDPAVCQAYCDPDTAAEKYGDQAEEYMARLRQAVADTSGQVMTYDGALIAATYFSCSGGRTESAQAVWGSSVPYLLSVDSPGEESASSYESTVEVDKQALMELLDIDSVSMERVTYTDGGGVDTITIGGTDFSGVELRRLLGLRSTCFTVTESGETVTFSVRGYGHRVGLSQYGAKAMAEAGSDYMDILTWYYSGAELSEAV